MTVLKGILGVRQFFQPTKQKFIVAKRRMVYVCCKLVQNMYWVLRRLVKRPIIVTSNLPEQRGRLAHMLRVIRGVAEDRREGPVDMLLRESDLAR